MKFFASILLLAAAAVLVFACFCVYWAFTKPDEVLTYSVCAVVNFVNSITLAMSAKTLRSI
jgi:hypothetical protein